MGHSSHSHGSHGHGGHAEVGHVVPVKTFTAVLVLLLVLTVITVAVAQVDFGSMNLVVAMVIASIKATLVITIFMHGAYENKILWTYILIPFVLLAVMIAGIFTDDPYRSHPQPMVPETRVVAAQ
jgi:cytochrome c oxidase subunit 4